MSWVSVVPGLGAPLRSAHWCVQEPGCVSPVGPRPPAASRLGPCGELVGTLITASPGLLPLHTVCLFLVSGNKGEHHQLGV